MKIFAVLCAALGMIASTPGLTWNRALTSTVPENSGRVIMTALDGTEIRWSPKIGTYRLERG